MCCCSSPVPCAVQLTEPLQSQLHSGQLLHPGPQQNGKAVLATPRTDVVVAMGLLPSHVLPWRVNSVKYQHYKGCIYRTVIAPQIHMHICVFIHLYFLPFFFSKHWQPTTWCLAPCLVPGRLCPRLFHLRNTQHPRRPLPLPAVQ